MEKNNTLKEPSIDRPSKADATECQFRDIANSVPAFIFETNATGNLTFLNQSLADFFGLTGEESSTFNYVERIHPGDRARAQQKFLLEADKPGVVALEFRMKGQSDSYSWFLGTCIQRFDDQGKPNGYVGTCVEITQPKESAEQAEFEARALDQVNEAVIAIDINGLITYWNEAATRLYGFERDEVIGKPLREINKYEWLRSEDENEAMAALAEKGYWHGENLHTRKCGKKFVTNSSVSTLKDDQGNSIGLLAVIRDITDQRAVEEAYRTSEARFRAQFKGTPVPIFSWQRTEDDFVLADFNDAASEMTEHRLESFIGIKASELYRDRPELVELMCQCCENQETIHRELEYRLATTCDLKRLDVSFVFVPPDLVLVHTEDVTESSQAEVALREAERKYRDIFENSTGGIFQTTTEGKFVEANPALARMLGYESPTQLVSEITTRGEIHVDKVRRDEFRERVARDGFVRNFEYEAYRRDGSTIWISEDVRAVVDENGRVRYYEGTAEDITERKSAEDSLREQKELLQRIFDHVPVAINFIDPYGGIELVNPAWEQMMGVSLDEVREKKIDVFVEFYPDPEYRQEVKKFVESSNGQWKDFKATMRDGRLVDMSWAVVHLSDGGFIGIGQDISERKHAEEALQNFSRRLIQAQEAERQRIARELHDEIGQILTAVRLNLQLIETACATPGCIPYINENVGVVDEALRLVRDLSFDLRPSLLDDLGLVAALRWYIKRYATRTGIEMELKFDSLEAAKRLPHEIETAAFRIIQEALTNVVRHAQAKNVVVQLKRESGGLVLRVRDDGIGFDVLSIKRGSAAVSLGLLGMEERAMTLGGRMNIISAPGKGTKVNTYLPIRDLESTSAENSVAAT